MILRQIAYARSGDKGNSANIGLIAYTKAGYDWMEAHITEKKVFDHFSALGLTGVKRYQMPNLGAFNFVLENALGGGASRSLRIDAQGKALGDALLEMEIELSLEQLKNMIKG